MTAKQLYTFSISGLVVGYVYLVYDTISNPLSTRDIFTPCFIKNVTGVPCPSCGSTRAVKALLHLDLAQAIHWNPLGFIILAAMLVLPFWIGYDLVSKKNTYHLAYQRFETLAQRRAVLYPAALLLLLNWIWTISKGL